MAPGVASMALEEGQCLEEEVGVVGVEHNMLEGAGAGLLRAGCWKSLLGLTEAPTQG